MEARRRPTDALAALVLAFAIAAPGCRPPDERTVLDAYFTALQKGRIADAYALTAADYRAHHDLETFALGVARQPIVERAERSAPSPEVVVELGVGATAVRLVAEGKRAPLRLMDDPRDYYPRATPDQVLASFSRAVELGRSARAWSLVTPALHAGFGVRSPLTPQMIELGRRIERALSSAQPAPLVIEGGKARLLLGDGLSVSIERGANGWEIASLE